MISRHEKRTAHQQICDWFAAQGLTCDAQLGNISHWRLGPKPFCLVALNDDKKACTIHWSKMSLLSIAKCSPDRTIHTTYVIQNRDELREFRKLFGFLATRSRVSAYQKIEKLNELGELPMDPYDLVDAINLKNLN